MQNYVLGIFMEIADMCHFYYYIIQNIMNYLMHKFFTLTKKADLILLVLAVYFVYSYIQEY
ncbi:hypothetical protein CMU00_17385 [Elizabethkingia anophelis]|nr:hypothetical protein [Elizabethkingia anophelis]